MQDNNYIEKLKDCITSTEVYKLMNGRVYKESDNSKFEDSHIRLLTRTRTYMNSDFELEGIYSLALRVMTFIKLDGKLKDRVFGSGANRYMTQLRYVLREFSIIKPNLKTFNEIDSDLIDLYILNRKESNPILLKERLLKIIDWINYGNKILPIFLRLNEYIFSNSKEYKLLLVNAKNERKRQELYKFKNIEYPLFKLKDIASCAINDIEYFAVDGLTIAKLLVRAKVETNIKNQHSYIYNYFAKSRYKIKEEKISKIQTMCKEMYRLGYKASSIASFKNILIDFIDNIEAACTIVILLTTGMRSSELVSLNRNVVISENEYLNLVRFVYKTAKHNNGEELTMPIPLITKDALILLSKINEIKDVEKDGQMILNSIRSSPTKSTGGIVRKLITKYVKNLGKDNVPRPHQLRHAMAFLITYSDQKDGLELAKLFLGHSSIIMTLQYIGHYNLILKKAISEMQEKESQVLVEKVLNEIKDGHKLYGPKGEKLLSNHQFTGSYADELADLLNKSLMGLIKNGQLAIIQTSVCICIHDLTKTEEMICQRGLNINDFIESRPIQARCRGESCVNSLFTESAVKKLKLNGIDSELRSRLMKNTYFADSGGFDNDPFQVIINKYEKDQKE